MSPYFPIRAKDISPLPFSATDYSESSELMKALIAMSGGVDSAVAALLMKNAGFDCIGCTMRLYENDTVGLDMLDTCCSLENTKDAGGVCEKIGIPYRIFHYENEFRECVIEPFIKEYELGCTPNPCIECNDRLKFGYLLEKAEEEGCDYLVTGHYAIIDYNAESGKYQLRKAADLTKDQTYVLYSLTQSQLAHLKFPLGNMEKTQTRELAAASGFCNAGKHDSQDICFVPDGDYTAFIERYTGKTYPGGNYVDSCGNIIGRHKGYIHYTIGQRKGLGVAFGEPRYVSQIDPESNTVTLATDAELYTDTVNIKNVNWISGEIPSAPVRCKTKIRYRHRETECTVYPDGNGATIIFDEAVRAVTPGQSAVMYDGDIVLGGGKIISGSDNQ